MENSKAVEIKCSGAETMDIDEMTPFQGNLKDLSYVDYKKLRSQILDLGFSEPIGIWKNDGKNFVISGHQRLRVLHELRKTEGYFVPAIPVSIIEAKTEYEAKKKILAMASVFGEVKDDGLFQFMSENNIDIPTFDDFKFPEIDQESFKENFFDFKLPGEGSASDGGSKEPRKHTCPECGCRFNVSKKDS